MVNITLSVPDEMKAKMESFAEINWSAVAREAFNQKIQDLDFLKKFKEKSTLTAEEALKLGRELNQSLAKKKK